MHYCLRQCLLLLAVFWNCCYGQDSKLPLETINQWTILNYDFPWDWPQTDKNFYNPENVVATGITIGIDRIFLSTPRLFNGVPATLSTLSRNQIGDSPVLQVVIIIILYIIFKIKILIKIQAYPDWSHHAAGQRQYNCSDIGLVSVYRIRIDSCNRLWVLDSGKKI